jgi:hypothetical protein
MQQHMQQAQKKTPADAKSIIRCENNTTASIQLNMMPKRKQQIPGWVAEGDD